MDKKMYIQLAPIELKEGVDEKTLIEASDAFQVNFVNKFKDDIVQKWIDYFVYHKSIECIKIEGKVK